MLSPLRHHPFQNPWDKPWMLTGYQLGERTATRFRIDVFIAQWWNSLCISPLVCLPCLTLWLTLFCVYLSLSPFLYLSHPLYFCVLLSHQFYRLMKGNELIVNIYSQNVIKFWWLISTEFLYILSLPVSIIPIVQFFWKCFPLTFKRKLYFFLSSLR